VDYLNMFLTLLATFFASWQVRTIGALILTDVVFGVMIALRTSTFNFQKLADFYKSMVLPYILGYLVLYLVVGFVLPPNGDGGTLDILNQASVTLAWAALAGTLLASLKEKWSAIYSGGEREYVTQKENK
jgi:hypothetical protein